MSVLISRDLVREPLHCVVPLFNPWRFKSRYKHVTRALKHFADSGAVITLVEIAFNRREFVFADSGLDGTVAPCSLQGGEFRHKYIGLRTKDELWLKENAINVGVQSLPYNWQQVIWLDGDVIFMRPNWVGETIQALQHYAFIQPFTHARDVGPNYELLPETHPHADGMSFAHAFQEDVLPKANGYYGTKADEVRVWPGLAWAARREAWDAVGGLQDFHVWGGADHVMSWGLVEQPDRMIRKDLHPNYKAMAYAWMEKCKRFVRKNVGAIDGSIFHFYHGPKQARGYNTKHKLLADIGFDPIRHLKRDAANLWQLNDTGEDSYIKLRDTMRAIAKSRNEDSTEVSYFGVENH